MLFVVGAVVLARPFVTRRSTLLIAVPAAAIAGVAVLGAVALVCAVVIAVAESDAGSVFGDVSWPGGGRDKRRR
jgi:hypothetical protein